jgi:hypothetical protein
MPYSKVMIILTDPVWFQVSTHQGKLSREEELVYHGHISNAEMEQRLNYNSDAQS